MTMSVGRPTRFVKLSNPSLMALKSLDDGDSEVGDDGKDNEEEKETETEARDLRQSLGMSKVAASIVLQRFLRGWLARWEIRKERSLLVQQQQQQQHHRRQVASCIVLQSIARGFLARQEYHSLVVRARRREQLILERILEQARQEKNRMKLEEIKHLERRYQDIQEQTKVEIKQLKDQFKEGKRALKERGRRKYDKMMSKIEKEQKAEKNAQDTLTLLELSELGEESKRLREEMAELEKQVSAMTKENTKLQKANNDVATLFHSLNDFVRKQTNTKKKLAVAIQNLKPKLKSDIQKGSIACKVETRLRATYRDCM